MDEVRNAFRQVVWYNGYEEEIERWLDEISKNQHNGEHILPLYTNESVDWFKMSRTELFDYAQLQVLWMMLISLFGDYGISPRFGWIEDTKACANFLKEIVEELKQREYWRGD